MTSVKPVRCQSYYLNAIFFYLNKKAPRIQLLVSTNMAAKTQPTRPTWLTERESRRSTPDCTSWATFKYFELPYVLPKCQIYYLKSALVLICNSAKKEPTRPTQLNRERKREINIRSFFLDQSSKVLNFHNQKRERERDLEKIGDKSHTRKLW